MKKLLSIFIIFLVVFFGFKALAVEPVIDFDDILSESAISNGVDCFDYYKFQSVQVNVGPNKSAFTAGEDVDFSGKIENENKYPVFNGYVYVRIAEKNPSYIQEGHNIVDEFIALGPISVDASSSVPVSFSWKIPESLKTGDYTANYFFSVNKKMNLGGLPFTNEIIVGFADFSIASTKTGNVSFVKSSTKVNEAKYNHIGNWPLISPNGKAVVLQVIQNTLKQDINTEISYNLYYWDSLDPKDLISTKKESLTLKAGESKTLTYEISKVSLSAYYLQIVAKNENGTKSIVNMRITSDIAKPRINYFGLDNFPIQKGATTTLYSCFHNTSNISASGTTVLIAKDKVGREISRVEYSGVIPSAISAQKTEFIANSKLDYVKLEQKIYDEQNNLLDTQEIIYDVSLVKEPEIKAEPINPIVVSILVGLIIFGFLLFTLRPIRKNKNLCLVISLVIISLAGALLILFMQARPVKAQSTLENFQKSQSGVVAKPVSVGWIGKRVNQGFFGSVQYNYTINTTADSPVIQKGENFSFAFDAIGSFNGTGGGMDTPFFGEKFSGAGHTVSFDGAKWVPFNETEPFKGVKNGMTCSGGVCDAVGGAYGDDGSISATYKGSFPNPSDSRYGYRKQLDKPELGGIVSSDNNIIDCTSGICKAVCPGVAIVTVSVKPSTVILSYVYPYSLFLYKTDLSGYRGGIPFEGYTAKWVFRVTGPSCGGGGGSRGVGDIKLWADPSVVDSGGESTINWETTNMSSCQAIGGWSSSTAVRGEEKIENITEGKTFEISCSGIGGTKYASTSIGLNLKKPTVQLYANPQAVDPDGKSVISWISVNAQSCRAIPVIVGTKEIFWTSSTSTSGSKEVTLDKVAKTFSISCEGNNGMVGYATTTINILNPKETTEVVTASCFPDQNSSSKIYVNRQMTWNVVPDDVDVDLPSASTVWSGTNISEVENNGVYLNRIYTTVGLKTINATTTWKTGSTKYIATCSTSTNVILGGGGIHEI